MVRNKGHNETSQWVPYSEVPLYYNYCSQAAAIIAHKQLHFFSLDYIVLYCSRAAEFLSLDRYIPHERLPCLSLD